MFDYIFVDLDDTIFDTAKFKADIYKSLSVFDVKEVDFKIAYKNAAELPRFGYYDYTFERQVEALREMGYVLEDKIIISLNNSITFISIYFYFLIFNYTNGKRHKFSTKYYITNLIIICINNSIIFQ